MIRNLIANFLFWLMMAGIFLTYGFVITKVAGAPFSAWWILLPIGVVVLSFILIIKFFRETFVMDTFEETGNEF